jgi:hypothetical protein
MFSQCGGTTKAGRRCQILSVHGYCQYHFPCHGRTRGGVDCNAHVRGERFGRSHYCCDDHDPANDRSTDPSLFRMENLCVERNIAVSEYRAGKDAYTDENIEDLPAKDCDHVFEIHWARDVYDKSIKHVGGSSILVREQIKKSINAVENLNFTTPETNKIKFDAAYSFAQDYKGGNVDQTGITHYLVADKRLTRKVTRNIKCELETSYHSFVDSVERDAGEDRIVGEFLDICHDMSVKMQL